MEFFVKKKTDKPNCIGKRKIVQKEKQEIVKNF